MHITTVSKTKKAEHDIPLAAYHAKPWELSREILIISKDVP